MQHEIQRSLHDQRKLTENRTRAENIQLYRAMVGFVKRPLMWRKLCARIRNVLKMDESMIQREFVANMKTEPDENSFTLDRPSYPKARVCAIFRENLLIEVHCSSQKTDNARLIEWEYLIELPVDDLDRVSFQCEGEILSQDDVALRILAPIRDPAFEPPEST